MLHDIVIDANVLMHADNAAEVRREDACKLLECLRHCKTQLCLDEGFHPDEARNRSQIYGEYRKHLTHGMLGFALLAHLAQSQRIKAIQRTVPSSVGKKIRQNVPNRQDRIYVQVAANSSGKTLTSHDFTDFGDSVRKRLLDAIGVAIVTAEAATAALSR